ncbi:2'-5' RNA ligase family protein [Streptomyces sp. NPDC006173]|uniref:2'-5' RNA ligase family protein n=1 Tax=Streptomyces sp. NPDC006173 TaxID=3155349 RepID=UPI0033E82AC9
MTPDTEFMRNHWWWRPGWSVGRRFYTWHFTFEGQSDIHRLAAEYRAALAPLGEALTPIPDQWLHLTMQGIGFVGEASEKDVSAIVEAARARLAAVPAFDIEIGPAVLDPEAILLHAHPDEPVRAVRDAIRAAIGDVLDVVPEKAAGFTPHVSVAYSAGDGPAAPAAQVLGGLDLVPARARISSAELIVLHRDNQMYEWDSYAAVPLG